MWLRSISDENSRLLPGQKDVVSIMTENGRIHMQKRLVLLNLKELHKQFKMEHPEHKIGFSAFATLRPKWCILAGASGTHTICVCTHHQNPKLKLESLKDKHDLTCSILMAEAVCSMDSKTCMMHQCAVCPGKEYIKNKLKEFITSDEVEFTQWVSTDRCSLITIKENINEFIEKLSQDVYQLTLHHFISKHQGYSFSEAKKHIKTDEAVVQLDFAENYTMVIQNASQSSYFDGKQATLHPYIVYCKEGDETKSKSFKLFGYYVHNILCLT